LELINNTSKALRCHDIEWEDAGVTEESFGLNNEEQLVDKPYQFSITQSMYGRVHGFFIEDIFFIRWIDKDHNLYDKKD
jgi:hypothetical protein